MVASGSVELLRRAQITWISGAFFRVDLMWNRRGYCVMSNVYRSDEQIWE